MPTTLVSFSEEESLMYITLVFDNRSSERLNNLMGLYGIPPRGGFYWWTVNHECGGVESESEAIAEIKKQWKRSLTS